MALEEGSGAVERLKGKEFGGEFVFVSEIKSTSWDPLGLGMEVAAVVQKLMMDNAKQFARFSKLRLSISIDGIDEVQKEVETGKAAAVIDEIQSEKMDKAPVDGDKNQFCTMTREASVETGKEAVAIEKNQTERCAESDPPAGKHRLDGDYVRCVLAMPRELPCKIPFSRGNNIAELLGVTEECLEKKRQKYREAAARLDRTAREFALFQDKVSEEYDRLGYVEVDDEYLDGVAELQEFSEELCKDKTAYKFYDPDRCEPAEVLCSVKKPES